MTRLSLLLTTVGLAGLLAAPQAPRVATPPTSQPSGHVAAPAAPVVTRAGAAAWVRDFGKFDARQGALTTFTRPDGC